MRTLHPSRAAGPSRLLLGVLLLACAFPAARAQGQGQAGADDEAARAGAYRAAKEAATKIFLDPDQPKAARLEAAAGLGYPEDETFAAMLEIGADSAVDDEIRWAALRHHRFNEGYLEVVLGILGDPDDGGAELVADLIEDLSRRTTFRLPAPIEQKILATLRKLLDDPRQRVRLSAYRVLVAGHDTVAVNRLAESLRQGEAPENEDSVPIPLDEAIDLLNIDGSVFHVGALRPYLDHEDPRIRAQAAQALAVDPRSRPRIVALATSPEADEEVRLSAIRSLAREDDRFAGYAIELVDNREESPTIRHAAMKAFAGRMNYRQVADEDQIRFAEAVERLLAERELARSEGGRELQGEAKELLAYLQEAFPAIERHYANP